MRHHLPPARSIVGNQRNSTSLQCSGGGSPRQRQSAQKTAPNVIHMSFMSEAKVTHYRGGWSGFCPASGIHPKLRSSSNVSRNPPRLRTNG